MANLVYHHCDISGDANEIERLRTLVLQNNKAGKAAFSFQAVIPMPDFLIVSIEEALGAAVVGHNDPEVDGNMVEGILDRYLAREGVKFEGITTRDQLVAWVKKTQPEMIERGKRRIEFLKQTGYKDWYDWRTDKWGTKWECLEYRELSFTPDCWTFTFATAWNPPEPVLDKLFKELFPTLVADIAFVDEMPDFAGTFLYENGECDKWDTYELSEMVPLYELCLGHPLCFGGDDDEVEASPERVAELCECIGRLVKLANEGGETPVITG